MAVTPPKGYMTVTQAAQFAGITLITLRRRIERYNQKHKDNPIEQWTPESGDVYKYYLEEDIKRLIALRPVKRIEVQEAR